MLNAASGVWYDVAHEMQIPSNIKHARRGKLYINTARCKMKDANNKSEHRGVVVAMAHGGDMTGPVIYDTR